MTITVRVIGEKELQAAIRKLGHGAITEVWQGMQAGGLKVEETIKRGLKAKKSGRVYRRGKKGYHVASAPGEFPAVDSGRMIGSIAMRASRAQMVVFVGVSDLSNVRYARLLEYGTSKVAARPWLLPSVKASEPFMRKRVRDGLRDAIRKAGGR